MGYRVDLDALDVMIAETNTQGSKWNSELSNVSVAINALIQSDNISGVGADSIRGYLEMCHKPIIMSLGLVIRNFLDMFLIYRTDYINEVDSAAENVLIVQEELEEIKEKLAAIQSSILTISEQAEYDVKQVNGILSDNSASIIPIKRADDILDLHRDIRLFIVNIDDAINAIEDRHCASDFVEMDAAMVEVKSQITTYFSKSRSFIESFDSASLENITRYNRLVTAINPVIANLNTNAVAIQNATDSYNLMMDEKARLIQERAEEAKWNKLAITAAVIVVAAVVTIAIPVSGPLVAGAVSGVSSAIISANNSYQDQYVLSGDRSEIDIGEVALEGGKGFATGFVTGVVGGAANQAIGGALGKIPLTHSSNYATNVVANAVTGSVTEVTAGFVTRSTGEILSQAMDDEAGIDWDAVGEKTFDGAEILKDAVIGGVSGARTPNEQDFSKSGNTKYEQDVLNEMYESGELEGVDCPDWDTGGDGGNEILDFFIKKKDRSVPRTAAQEYFGDGYHHEYVTNEQGELVEDAVGKIQTFSANADKVLKDASKIFKQSDFFETLTDYGDGYTKLEYMDTAVFVE